MGESQTPYSCTSDISYEYKFYKWHFTIIIIIIISYFSLYSG